MQLINKRRYDQREMKKILVLEFNPLMVILLILSIVIPVGFTVSLTTPAMAVVNNVTVTLPTTTSPTYISTLSGVATVPVTCIVGADAGTNGDIELNVYATGTTNLIWSQPLPNVPLPITGLNTLTGYHAQVPMGTPAGSYDLVVAARQGATWIYSSCNCTTNVALSASNPGYGAIIVKNTLPTATSLISPGNGSYTKVTTPFLSWSCVTDPTGISYNYQVSNNQLFTGATTVNWPSCNKTLGALPDGLYYWRVQSQDGAGNTSAWTAPWSFCLDTLAPSVPSNIGRLPADTTLLTASYNPTLEWVASTHTASCSPVRYWVQVSQDATFTTVTENITDLQIPSYTPVTNLGSGTWYWQIRAYDLAWNLSGWSTVWSFTKPGVVSSYPITLGANWNLISPPLYPNNTAIATVLAGVSDNISMVLCYDPTYTSGSSPYWRMWWPTLTNPSLTAIEAGKAYWIQMDPALVGVKTLTIYGTQQRGAPNPEDQITLYPGWNMVGYKSVISRQAINSGTPTGYFNAIVNQYAALYYYASNLVPLDLTTGTLNPGKGYWIYMISQGRFFLPGQ